uniref:Uncharacterized protein n=1 Tax=Anguilla anguilla TaxID=7936 RepID=A0A0E9WG21_ANGAN
MSTYNVRNILRIFEFTQILKDKMCVYTYIYTCPHKRIVVKKV